jgi:hypothetical protein
LEKVRSVRALVRRPSRVGLKEVSRWGWVIWPHQEDAYETLADKMSRREWGGGVSVSRGWGLGWYTITSLDATTCKESERLHVPRLQCPAGGCFLSLLQGKRAGISAY